MIIFVILFALLFLINLGIVIFYIVKPEPIQKKLCPKCEECKECPKCEECKECPKCEECKECPKCEECKECPKCEECKESPYELISNAWVDKKYNKLGGETMKTKSQCIDSCLTNSECKMATMFHSTDKYYPKGRPCQQYTERGGVVKKNKNWEGIVFKKGGCKKE
jgi:hypothetical protein